ncbi:hypothetical protein TUBRATIS_30370 [Tubulinosema ratisbonensis]|uniref:Uncharacterized protein n=1 Tax=Tubulinosema ratisbonensis TaxID=291195 RepID=A0A437AHJ7_9MICR|nr:hypothetical protein TUBRATIS_30370 [Tubulinosema ratisbonensis]
MNFRMEKDFEEMLDERLEGIFKKNKKVEDYILCSSHTKENKNHKIKITPKKSSIKHNTFFYHYNGVRNKFNKIERFDFPDYKYEFDKLYTKIYHTNTFDEILTFYEKFDR